MIRSSIACRVIRTRATRRVIRSSTACRVIRTRAARIVIRISITRVPFVWSESFFGGAARAALIQGLPLMHFRVRV